MFIFAVFAEKANLLISAHSKTPPPDKIVLAGVDGVDSGASHLVVLLGLDFDTKTMTISDPYEPNQISEFKYEEVHGLMHFTH